MKNSKNRKKRTGQKFICLSCGGSDIIDRDLLKILQHLASIYAPK